MNSEDRHQDERLQDRTDARLAMEAQVAVLVERLDNHARITNSRFDQLRIDFSEFRAAQHEDLNSLRRAMEALVQRERERNGHVAELMRYKTANDERWNEHLSWATERNQVLEGINSQHHDGSIRAGVLKSQLKFVLGGSGLGGLIVGGAVLIWNLLGIQVGP